MFVFNGKNLKAKQNGCRILCSCLQFEDRKFGEYEVALKLAEYNATEYGKVFGEDSYFFQEDKTKDKNRIRWVKSHLKRKVKRKFKVR